MNAAWAQVLLGVVSALIIPLLVLLVRAVVRWQRVEDKLNDVDEDVRGLKDQVREVRDRLDRRLRWLEENLWKPGPRR